MFAKVSLAILAAITANFAGAAVLENRAVSPDASFIIEACTGRIDPPEGCVNIPVVADTCVSFTGGLTFLDNAITVVRVPDGFICSFFDKSNCASNGEVTNPSDTVFLQGGVTDLEIVQGLGGPENFRDLASSFGCSPIYEELTKEMGSMSWTPQEAEVPVDDAHGIVRQSNEATQVMEIYYIQMRGKKQPKALSGALGQGLGLNQGLKGFKTSTQGLMGGHWEGE
ncbi:hypothetical protein GGX14DRAFT_404162 [Mycena pura]|uniref:Uncharacterized protein n=1 Tax=Mycena pura TaxID=153505 RepID=A0AAD6UUK8_9AGAR|nr:hypothetical protein GGX14DRAFT_404162 [Mycena pura]